MNNKFEVILLLKRLEDGRVVDSKTGEVMTENTVYTKINETVKVIEVKNKPNSVLWGEGRPFVKVFIDYMPQLALRLSGGALAIVLRLTEYINYDSGLVTKHSGGSPLTNNDIQTIMWYSNKTIVKLMGELVDKKVFFRGRTGHCYQYYANPYLFTRGKTINKTLKSMFKDYPDVFSRG